MKKINYFENCELEYLSCLGLWDKETKKKTARYKELNKAWLELRKDKKLYFLPKQISKILIAKYELLLVYFRYFDNWISEKVPISDFKKEDGEINKDAYNSAMKDLLRPFVETFNYSVTPKDITKIQTKISPFSDKIADFFVKHSEELNIYSCCYCETAYTGVYLNENEERRTFDIDHFFPKEQYPIFSLSLYNFVPSCQYCNSRAKASTPFKVLYKLNKKIETKDILYLIKLSPTGSKYDFYNNSKIRIIPNNPDNQDNWEYSDNSNMYKIIFDHDIDNTYIRAINAFHLEGRYNLLSIKNHAIYLETLKRKNPDEHIFEIATFLTQAGYPTTFEQVKNSIFHTDEKYQLLEKMKNDILNN